MIDKRTKINIRKLFPAAEVACRAASAAADKRLQDAAPEMLAILRSIISHSDSHGDAETILAAHDKAIRYIVTEATGGKDNA